MLNDWDLNRIREIDDVKILSEMDRKAALRPGDDGFRDELVSTCEKCEMGYDMSDSCDEITCPFFKCYLSNRCQDSSVCTVDRSICIAYKKQRGINEN